MNSQDSWIDPDELDELVGVFSKGKKKKKKKKSRGKKVSAKRDGEKKSRSGKTDKASGDSKKSVADSGEVPEKKTVEISSIDDLDDYLVDDTPPPLVFEGRATPEEVAAEEDLDQELAVEEEHEEGTAEEDLDQEVAVEEEHEEVAAEENLDQELAVEEEHEEVAAEENLDQELAAEKEQEEVAAEEDLDQEAVSEEEETLISSKEGTVVFVQDDENEEPGTSDGASDGTFDIDPDPEWGTKIEVVSAEEDSPEEIAAEEDEGSPLYEGGEREFITVDEDDDEYGTANPGLLSEDKDSEEAAEVCTTEEDAARAVKALAEARADAESAELLCLRKWAELEEVEIAAEVEEEEPVSVKEYDSGESLLDIEAEDEEADSITILEEVEEKLEPEPEVDEEILEPLPEFRTSPAATMVERVSEYVRIVKKGVGAQSVVIRDEHGYLVYDDRADGCGPVDSIDVVRKLREIEGAENVFFSQIRLTNGQWLCVISSPAAAGDLITQAIIDKPVRHSRLIELSQIIATAIRPANVA